MANELTVSASLKFEKSGGDVSGAYGGIQINVTGDNAIKHIQAIGTSEEVVQLGDVTTGGYWLFKNLDTTNFLQIRAATGATNLVRLNAGEIALFRTSASITPYAIADTAACNLLCIGIDA